MDERKNHKWFNLSVCKFTKFPFSCYLFTFVSICLLFDYLFILYVYTYVLATHTHIYMFIYISCCMYAACVFTHFGVNCIFRLMDGVCFKSCYLSMYIWNWFRLLFERKREREWEWVYIWFRMVAFFLFLSRLPIFPNDLKNVLFFPRKFQIFRHTYVRIEWLNICLHSDEKRRFFFSFVRCWTSKFMFVYCITCIYANNWILPLMLLSNEFTFVEARTIHKVIYKTADAR